MAGYPAVLAAALLLASELAAQQSQATALLVEARVQIQAACGDSAARLLARVLDPSAGASVAARVEALVLRGVLEFFQGQDSATARSFRDALTLNPSLQAPLLANFDTALVTILESQRTLLAASPDTVVRDCSTRCPAKVLHPRVQQYGDFEPFNPEGFALSHSLDHRPLVLRYIVSATGRVEGKSVRVLLDGFTVPGLDSSVVYSLRQTRYLPAQAGGKPVRSLIEVRCEFRRVDRPLAAGIGISCPNH
jgi:hypothetical protein